MIPLIIFIGVLKFALEISSLRGKFIPDDPDKLSPPESGEEISPSFYVTTVHLVYLFSIIAFYGVYYYGSFRVIGANPDLPTYLAYLPLSLGIWNLLVDMFDYPSLINKEKAIVTFKNRAYDKEKRNFSFYRTVGMIVIAVVSDIIIVGAVIFTA